MFSLGLLVGSQNSWLPLILSRRPHLLSLSTVARQHAILAVAGNVNPRKSFEEQTSLSVLLPWPGDTGNQLGRALPFAQSPIHSTPFIECLCVPGISMSSSELLTLGVGGEGGDTADVHFPSEGEVFARKIEKEMGQWNEDFFCVVLVFKESYLRGHLGKNVLGSGNIQGQATLMGTCGGHLKWWQACMEVAFPLTRSLPVMLRPLAP